jgi:myo-inositol-1-phosphate synthase
VIIDAIRAAKIAKDRGIGGTITSASADFMKATTGAVLRLGRLRRG